MTWGPMFLCYHCPDCGLKFKYELGVLNADGELFGKCPVCKRKGVFDKEGPNVPEFDEYEDV